MSNRYRTTRRQFLLACVAAVGLMPVAITAAAPRDEKNSATTTELSPQISDDIVRHVEQMSKKDEGEWEKAARTLETKYGVGSLPALKAAKLFSQDTAFQDRCAKSIKKIEQNVKEGLAGGRSKE